jgi:uncharacterized protein (DUF983 family)
MNLTHLLKEECPRCHHGKVFNSSLLSFNLHMNKECQDCHLSFTKEPGFYWGAMFVSYGLATAEIFISYFVCRLFGTGTFDMINLWVAIGVIVVLSAFNFKLSRMIWLYLFPKDK